MTLYATVTSTCAKSLLAGAALCLLTPAAALAQQMNEEPDAGEVARTPLRDLNISSREIPEVLQIAARDPYASDGLNQCNDLVREIAALDQILGADFDIGTEEEGGISEGRVAQSVIGSLIPFRGIVREVTGANAKKRQLNLAVTAGMVRRGFLKGLGQQRGCSYPASPREERGTLISED